MHHSPETCRHLKGFRHDWDLPPRSPYTKLPRSFYMQRTRRGPAFLAEAARRDNFLRCKLKNYEFEWFVYEPQTLRLTASSRQPR